MTATPLRLLRALHSLAPAGGGKRTNTPPTSHAKACAMRASAAAIDIATASPSVRWCVS